MERDVKKRLEGRVNGRRDEGGGRGGGGARVVAMRVLLRLEEVAEARASEVLDRALREVGDARERGLATELVYGVLRWRKRLDLGLERWLQRGLGGVEPAARTLLRLGAYQLHVLDRIPREIVVSATQDAARAAGLGRLTGLLNAVLRREAGAPFVAPEGEGVPAVAVAASLPNWVAAEVARAFPEAVRAEALALRERGDVTLRPTRGRLGGDGAGAARALVAALNEEGVESELVARGQLVRITGGNDPFRTRCFREGMFVAQDGASLAVVDAVEAAVGGTLAGKRVLDLCAGRGVKATALADRGARVVAADVAEWKLVELMRVARVLGVAGQIEQTVTVDAAGADAARVLGGLGGFDAVLVDAPCTGLGTLRRHPELVWRRRPEEVGELVALQDRLIEAGAERVAVGGALVFAVCSFVKAEGAVRGVPGWVVEQEVAMRPSAGIDAFQMWRARRGA